MRCSLVLGSMAACAALVATARDAGACGGCFHPPNESGTVVTDHRMIFSITQQQTTLYDEIEYQGSPSSFAWVLPIHGTVTVGLSADVVFAALEQATQTTIVPPERPPCPPPPDCSCNPNNFDGAGDDASAGAFDASADAGVTVNKQQVVGPYDTVQVHSSDPNALDTWLNANGYSVPSDVQPIIAAYVNEGFDFLALRLAPGQGVQAMRPVRVTAQGAGLGLPLRMIAAGSGATVGLTLWVVADGRYEPQNFKSFVVDPSQIVWDWSTSSSNYRTLRAQQEQSLNNAAWQIESSIDTSPYQIENVVLYGNAASDYSAIPGSDGGAGESADQVRQDDMAALFPGGASSVRITRMRGDLSHAALANDLQLQASANQNQISNDYYVTQQTNVPQCPTYGACPPCPDGGGYDPKHPFPWNQAHGSTGGISESFGCATGGESRGGAFEAIGLAAIAAAIVRARARRAARRESP